MQNLTIYFSHFTFHLYTYQPTLFQTLLPLHLPPLFLASIPFQTKEQIKKPQPQITPSLHFTSHQLTSPHITCPKHLQNKNQPTNKHQPTNQTARINHPNDPRPTLERRRTWLTWLWLWWRLGWCISWWRAVNGTVAVAC